MTKHYLLETKQYIKQGLDEKSYIGGIPMLPENTEIPTCKLCKAKLVFLFQVSFPIDHVFFEKTISFFYCINCEHEDFIIPKLPTDKLTQIVLERGFFENYETNFRIYFFETNKGKLVDNYIEKVKYQKLIFKESSQKSSTNIQLGGNPYWILEDESPKSVENENFLFILQIPENFEFIKNENAPQQQVIGLNGQLENFRENFYQTFVGNGLYFFATESENPQFYIIPQR